MNTKNSNFQINKKSSIALSIVMILNFVLGGFLIHNVLAQKEENDFKNQQPIKAEILFQENSPLRIIVSHIDNSNISYQRINFTLQNITNKKIRFFTVLGDSKNSGKIITSSFSTKLFQPNETELSEIDIEREVIKESNILSISIDYVEFEDGSFWGTDSQKKSENFAGERAGRLLAIKELRNLMGKGRTQELNDFLRQDITRLEPSSVDNKQSEQWKKGFRGGYKNVISITQGNNEKNVGDILKLLEEIEKNSITGGEIK